VEGLTGAFLGAVRLEERDASLDEGELVAIDLARDGERAAVLVRLSERCRAGEPEAVEVLAVRLTVAPEAGAELLWSKPCLPRDLMMRSVGAAPVVNLVLAGLELAEGPVAVVNESGGWTICHGSSGLEDAASVPIAPGTSALLWMDGDELAALRA
jgi:hypothetical protein